MKMSADGKVVEIMTEPDDDGNVYVEIPFDVLAKFVAAQQSAQWTGGESRQDNLFSAGEVLPAKVTRQSTRR